jgi:hypothetical protein
LLFWRHSDELVSGGPELCNCTVAQIVERDRVYRALRGQDAPQLRKKTGNKMPVLDRAKKDVGVEFPGSKTTGDEYVCYLQDGDGYRIETSHQYDTRDSSSHAEFHTEAGECRTDRSTVKQQELGANYIWHSATQQPPEHISGFHWIGNTGLAISNAECGKLFTGLEFQENRYGT